MSKKVRLTPQPSDHGPGPHYTQTPKQEIVFHGLIMAAAVVLILAGIKAASGIIAPMLLALFATIILLVPLRWLQSKGCPSILALIIVLGCVAIIFLGISRLVISSVADLSSESKIYAKRIEREFNRLEERLEDLGFRLDLGRDKKPEETTTGDETPEKDDSATNQNGKNSANGTAQDGIPPKSEQSKIDAEPALQPDAILLSPPEKTLETMDNASADATDVTSNNPSENIDSDVATEEDKSIFDQVRSGMTSLLTPPDYGDEEVVLDEDELDSTTPATIEPSLIDLNARSLMNWFTTVFNEVRNLVGKGFLVMIITLFMIFEASRFPAKIDRAFGKGPITNEHLHHIASEIRRYLFLKAISSVMSAVAATAVYLFFGVPAALFWGLIAFFLYFIPNIGGIIASIIPGLLIFMQFGPVGVMAYAVCLVAIECTIGYGIEPKILGHGLGISTVVIILSLITWGWLLGAIGLFLAAPLTIMVKIILQAFKETEWIAILIGDGSKRTM